MYGEWKTVRVFISSTFRDMHAERDYLVKFVFPALREKLEKHRIHLVDIDLRWGVTTDQADNDQALDLCLEQIDECRPLFVGILGERYGWVPEKYPDEAITKYGWIQHQTGKSITELEILYGVLRKQEMQSRAYFYFRDPSFTSDVPLSSRTDVIAEDDESADKLQQLKQEVINAELPTPPFVNYPCNYSGLKINWRLARTKLDDVGQAALEEAASDGIVNNQEYEQLDPDLQAFVNENSVVYLEGLKTFGDRVEAQLWEAIQAEHSLTDEPPTAASDESEPSSVEADSQERFMESRLRVYVGRQRDRIDLERFANEDDEVPCLVTGPAGSGKSALLARFLTDYRKLHSTTLVIPCFVGASPATSSLPGVLRYVCGVLRQRFNFELDLPKDDDELVTTFRKYLTLIPENDRVLLVIDALNQMDSSYQAHELQWLPEELPAHVKLVVSCTTDQTSDSATELILAQFHKRMVYSIDVHPLTDDERRRIVHEVPSLSAKTLDKDQVDLLLKNPATANPLFLLVALEELRGFGSFEELNARIKVFPQTGDTVTELFIQVVERLEVDFGHALVQRVLTLLTVARRGLSEAELEKLVISFDPSENLFPLLRQLRAYLFNREDLLNFYHGSLALAIRSHYLSSVDSLVEAHLVLADYFQSCEFNSRQIEELPWQLCEAAEWNLFDSGEWQRLYDLLARPDFVSACLEADFWDARRYWAQLEADSSLRMIDAYQPLLDAPSENRDFVWPIATLLGDTGHPREALQLHRFLGDHFNEEGDQVVMQDSLNAQAGILHGRGEFDDALELFTQAEKICREIGHMDGLQRVLGNQALIIRERGDWDAAMALHKQQEQICRELGNKRGLAFSLIARAPILFLQGDAEGALILHKQGEQLCRELGMQDGLRSTLNNQASILRARGDFEGAITLLNDVEQICRELGNKAGLQSALNHQAVIAETRGDLEGAMMLYKQVEQICRELGNQSGLATALGNQALNLASRGEFDRAIDLHQQEEEICRKLGNPVNLAKSLSNQGGILNDRDDLDGAMVLYKQAEQIYRNLDDKHGLGSTLGLEGTILYKRRDWKGAMALFKQEEQICREYGDKSGLATALGHQGLVLREQSRKQSEGLTLLRQQEQLCRELGDKNSLATCLINQASLLHSMRQFDEALVCAEESYDIVTRYGLTALAEQIKPILRGVLKAAGKG